MAIIPPDELDEEEAKAEAELDRLAAEAGFVANAREFPPDLVELAEAIDVQAGIRLGLPDEPPYQFDRYEAFSSKMGGMSMIIKGRDPRLDRTVAIKLWMTKGPESTRALMAEAQFLAKLNHPNVVAIHDSGQWRDRVYFVMEWVDGRDGQVWLRERTRPWNLIRDMFVLAGRGLAEAHRLGIVHRDFKPSNILIGKDGRVQVADFGVGARLESLSAEREPGAQPGTPMYMAPERLRGHDGDARSDQFSFCAALWKGLHGVRPYPGKERDEILAAIDSGTVHGIWDDDEIVPRWLTSVVARGLQPNPDDRFANMNTLLAALLSEPVEPSSVDEVEIEDPPDDDERVLHAPAYDPEVLRAASGEERRKSFLYGTLTGVGVMAALVLGLRLDPIPTRTTRSAPPVHETVTSPPAHEAEVPPQEEPKPEPRTTPDQVIAEIEAGNYDTANDMWLAERDRRTLDQIPTHHDSVRVGEAFLDAAKELAKAKKKAEATRVKEMAAWLAHAAISEFERFDLSTKPGSDLVKSIKDFEKSL